MKKGKAPKEADLYTDILLLCSDTFSSAFGKPQLIPEKLTASRYGLRWL